MDRVALVDRKIVDRQTTKNKLGDFCIAANKSYCRGGTPGHILAFSAEPMASLGLWLLHQQPS